MVRPITAVVAVILFGAAFVLILPSIETSPAFLALNPPEQYILYNVGFYLLFSGILGTVAARALRHGVNLKNILINGLGIFVLFSFVIDMLQPPFAVSLAGQFVIPRDTTLAGAAVDYMTGWVYGQIGITGPALYYAVYLATPIMAIVAAVLILGSRRFLRLYFG